MENRGSYTWSIAPRGYLSQVNWLVLQSNDSNYIHEYIESDLFYVQPRDYDTAIPTYTPTSSDRFIYPVGSPTFRINDTVTIQWESGARWPKLGLMSDDGIFVQQISDPCR